MWDEDGQDLIEYALLTALIAVAGILGFQAIGLAINASYTSWDTTNKTVGAAASYERKLMRPDMTISVAAISSRSLRARSTCVHGAFQMR